MVVLESVTNKINITFSENFGKKLDYGVRDLVLRKYDTLQL